MKVKKKLEDFQDAKKLDQIKGGGGGGAAGVRLPPGSDDDDDE